MNLKFRCPACNAMLGAPQTAAGVTQNCPKCNAAFVVPSQQQLSAGQIVALTPEMAAQQTLMEAQAQATTTQGQMQPGMVGPPPGPSFSLKAVLASPFWDVFCVGFAVLAAIWTFWVTPLPMRDVAPVVVEILPEDPQSDVPVRLNRDHQFVINDQTFDGTAALLDHWQASPPQQVYLEVEPGASFEMVFRLASELGRLNVSTLQVSLSN